MKNADDHRLSPVEDAGTDIDKLPSEILAYIFKLGTYSEEIWSDADAPKPVLLPWKISGVCRLWRSVALSTPFLWTHILIEYDYPLSIPTQFFTQTSTSLQHQLDRSKECPLNLVVRLGRVRTIFKSSPISVDSLRESLRAHLHRIRLLIAPDGFCNSIFPEASSSLPATSIFPALREVECTGKSGAAGGLDSIPFQQLTKITLRGMDRSVIWKAVQQSEVVEILDAISDSDSSPPPASTSNDRGLLLPRLTSLTLACRDEFLRTTSDGWIHSAPMLNELIVTFLQNNIDIDTITTFIQRSSCPLSSFTLYAFISLDDNDPDSTGKTTESSLKSLFSTVPTLTSLDMYLFDPNMVNVIIQILACSNTSNANSLVPEFCPSLRLIHLGIGDYVLHDFNLTSLVNMVHCRQPFGLEKVEIRDKIHLDSDISDEDRRAAEMVMGRFDVAFIF